MAGQEDVGTHLPGPLGRAAAAHLVHVALGKRGGKKTTKFQEKFPGNGEVGRREAGLFVTPRPALGYLALLEGLAGAARGGAVLGDVAVVARGGARGGGGGGGGGILGDRPDLALRREKFQKLGFPGIPRG